MLLVSGKIFYEKSLFRKVSMKKIFHGIVFSTKKIPRKLKCTRNQPVSERPRRRFITSNTLLFHKKMASMTMISEMFLNLVFFCYDMLASHKPCIVVCK
jgi:hypothetical protein